MSANPARLDAKGLIQLQVPLTTQMLQQGCTAPAPSLPPALAARVPRRLGGVRLWRKSDG